MNELDSSVDGVGGSAVGDLDALAQRLTVVRRRTEAIAAVLSAEDQTVQSMPDVSPTKWHRAHTTWFFAEFVLGPAGVSDPAWDRPEYRFLFNSYYEAVGARHPRPNRGLVTRPGVVEIGAYRAAVDAALADLFAAGRVDADMAATIELGINHEEQHQELALIDIKHVFSQNPAISPAYVDRPVVAAADPGPIGRVGFEGGLVPIGIDPDTGFFFDNESPAHEVRLYPFELGDRLVTAGEWLAFIDDGGYRRPELWKSDGWYTAGDAGWDSPLYWRRDPDAADRWLIHTLTGLRPLDPHEPVCHVSHYEADAFATWAGGRLATEFEWEHAARAETARDPDAVERAVFLDVDDPHFVFHPRAAEPGRSGVRQLFGDCWEWTASAYQPYPGFRVASGAIGEYNGKFMSGQQVLRGGGALTPRGHARVTYRNFFHPHTRWHLGGVRLAWDGER